MNIIFLFQCVFVVDKERGLILTEIAEGLKVEDIISSTGSEFQVADKLKMMADVTRPETINAELS